MDTISVPWNSLKAQMEERRHRPKMAPLQPPQSNVTNVSYHLHGHGSRVNVNSSDHSTNEISISGDQVFVKLREQIQNGIPEPDRTEILARLEALQEAQNQPTFLQRYTEFISFASGHMTLIAPFMPALAQLLMKIT